MQFERWNLLHVGISKSALICCSGTPLDSDSLQFRTFRMRQCLTVYNGPLTGGRPQLTDSPLSVCAPLYTVPVHFSEILLYYDTLLHYFHVTTFSCCTLFMLHFLHIALFFICRYSFTFHVFFVLHFLMLHLFCVALYSCFTFFICIHFMLHFFVFALFSFPAIFMLHTFHIALFPSCTIFMLLFFCVALFSCCLFCVALFHCCTFFMLHYIHVACHS